MPDGFLERRGWSKGWVPDADAVNGPVDGLLRMDNCVLDELGVVALRTGSAKINAIAFGDTDVHSLYTVSLSGTRYRCAGAGANVYVNGTSLGSAFAGSGDIAFGSHLGQILMARSTSKKKYDGTLRNWGITMSGALPTVASLAADSKVFASCASGETTHSVEEDDLTGPTYVTGQDGTGSGAIQINPSETTGRGTWTRTLGSETDYTAYTGGQVGTDDDLFEFFFYCPEPENLEAVTVMVDCNASSTNRFQDDYFLYEFDLGVPVDVSLPDEDFLSQNYEAEGYTREWIEAHRERARQATTAILRRDKPVSNAGWNHLTIRRGQFDRVGSTNGKGWNTVKAIRFTFRMNVGGAASACAFNACQIIGGAARPLTGTYRYRYVYVNNNTVYNALSPCSAASVDAVLHAQGATVTCPADASRDTQANEIWLYRMGGELDAYYRVKVKTGVSGAGAVAIDDTLSDRDALILNIRLQTDNTVPPDSVIDIEGPYYDRVFALTATHLYPSRRLDPDAFSAGQVVRVADASETAYWVRKTLQGLYIGTSKDIYALEGDGAELPDNTINFILRPLNIDHPPISEAVAQEGNNLVFLADDGWRAMQGAGSQALSGVTSTLYRGLTRHGVSSVNLATGRFRAAIAKGRLTAVTPEGASTTYSTVLYQHVVGTPYWYRFVYAAHWRCLYREPDGTVIGSDDAGFVWTLDTGTQDGGSNLAVTLWTTVDPGDTPYQRKEPWDIRIRADTAGATASVAIHIDGSGSAVTTISITPSGLTMAQADVTAMTTFQAAQLRITGTFSTFKWYDYALAFWLHVPEALYAEPKPATPSLQRRRFGGLHLWINTRGAAATVVPILDDADQASQTVTSTDFAGKTITFASVFGRDLWLRVTKTAPGFELLRWEPLILETLPPPIQGTVPSSNAAYMGEKVMAGFKVKCCTLGAARTFTPIIDGANQTTFSLTTDANEPDTYLHQFTAPLSGTDLAFSVNGQIELYDWEPIVLYRLPPRVKAWENKPLAPSATRRRFGGLTVQVDTKGAAATVTPILDGVAQTTLSVTTADLLGKTLTFTSLIGRDLWCQITGTTAFIVHSVEPIVLETLPQQFKGAAPSTNAGYAGEKVLAGIEVRFCTLGAAVTLTPILDGVDQTGVSVTTDANEPDTYLYQFTTPQTATDVAYKVSANVEVYSWAPRVLYQLPQRVRTWENKPLKWSTVRRRFGGLALQVNTYGAAVTVTPILDGVAQTPLSVTTADLLGVVRTFDAVVGRDLWCCLTGSTAFTPLAVEPIIVETLPQLFKGVTPRSQFGSPNYKTASGIQLRLCTVGAAVSITPVVDGVTKATHAQTVATVADDPEDVTIRFPTTLEAVEWALDFSGDVELYSWAPIITAARPLGVMVWDSGPLDLGVTDLVWIRGVRLKIDAGADVTVTPWFDGNRFDPVTLTVDIGQYGKTTVLEIPVGRGYRGRIPRIVLSSSVAFCPYWLEFDRRVTQAATERTPIRVPVGLGGQVKA